MTLELRIASPCDESWEKMTGDERSRHCARCNLNVFNVKELSEPELRALFLKTEGRVCGRLYRRPDGTVLTRDCPTGLARVRRRALGALALAVTMLVAVVGYRANAERSCATGDPEGSWFTRLFEQRFIDARETLRETKSFGPIINELFPPERHFTSGRMIMLPPKP